MPDQDGTDAYAYAKELRRFIMIKRTEGVSSTDIVGRMLMCTRDNARFREVRGARAQGGRRLLWSVARQGTARKPK